MIRSGDVTITKGPRIGGRQRVNVGNGWFSITRLWGTAHRARKTRSGEKRPGLLGTLVLIISALVSI
jgi:hypothetical protein